MGDQATRLLLSIEPGEDAEPQELEELSQRLRRDLLELEVDAVDLVREGSAPASAKGDPLTLGSLVVTLAPVALTGLMNLLQSWLARHKDATVTVKSPRGEIVVTGIPSKEQQQMIDAWVRRQGT